MSTTGGGSYDGEASMEPNRDCSKSPCSVVTPLCVCVVNSICFISSEPCESFVQKLARHLLGK